MRANDNCCKTKLICDYLLNFFQDILKNFFNDLAKNDPEYFHVCLKNLLKEDIALLQKYIKIK